MTPAETGIAPSVGASSLLSRVHLESKCFIVGCTSIGLYCNALVLAQQSFDTYMHDAGICRLKAIWNIDSPCERLGLCTGMKNALLEGEAGWRPVSSSGIRWLLASHRQISVLLPCVVRIIAPDHNPQQLRIMPCLNPNNGYSHTRGRWLANGPLISFLSRGPSSTSQSKAFSGLSAAVDETCLPLSRLGEAYCAGLHYRVCRTRDSAKDARKISSGPT